MAITQVIDEVGNFIMQIYYVVFYQILSRSVKIWWSYYGRPML